VVQRRHDVGGEPALVVRPPDIDPCHPRSRTPLACGGLHPAPPGHLDIGYALVVGAASQVLDQ